MPTTDEIERRVEQADAARSARRSAAAQQIGELAARRATIADQLRKLEQELGDVLAESSDVIEISELATFTDVPAAELTRWLHDRKSNRGRRKKSAAGSANIKRRKPAPAPQEPAVPIGTVTPTGVT
ncbi:hypothetical protein FPZ12_020220 [Amycolatopsis acidicola]|uniref:Uncharacterized protein n=1 Tax=Amycolatopsis acidicola TaxID=2596893 RepID=A0A5N0V3C8_9PSEU|nr:hypothetical protein [Amycolatopsis acidicola]KAA9159432.1 hypothetical protein FPZ12_020220 [Amycolatopsis acidicola]